jgi:DNA-binding beta-propeller fold protein YncE
MAFYPKSVGPLALRLLAVAWLLVWPKIGSAAGTWSVISLPRKPGEVVAPRALAADAAGDLYVADGTTGSARVEERDAQGSWSILATEGDAPGQVRDPSALAIVAAGDLYVADQGHGIQKRDAQGRWSVIANYGTDLGQVYFPSALATDTAGDLYVAESLCNPIGPNFSRIQKRDPQGSWSVIATEGPDVGQVALPSALAVDTTGNLYVAESGPDNNSGRIQKRDAQRGWSMIATTGDAAGQVYLPAAFAVDTAGNLYVADGSDGGRIQEREAQGSWSVIATAGDVLGEVDGPAALAVDRAGNLYVADNGNNRVLMYAPGP